MSDFNINFRIEGADEASDEVKKLTGETEKLSNAQEQNTTRVKSYKSQIKELKLELVQLGARTKENGDRYDELSQKIRDLDDAQEDLTIGTGQLDDQIAALPGPIGRAGAQFRTLDIALKNVKGAKVQLIKQFPILKNAIAATGIGALVILFGLLVGAVMKAFDSFKPLQQAVGRLGVAFDLVGKLVQPVIDLVGVGLTKAIDFAAESIAFLTGNLDEYNKEIEKVAAQDELNEKLEYEAKLWELQKDKFDEYTQSKLQAYRDNLDRFKEIDKMENISNDQKNKLKKESNDKYYRDLKNAETEKGKRDKENAKNERERLQKLNELTEEQIQKIKDLNRVTVDAIQRRIGLLKAREIEGLGNVQDIEKLKNATEFWNQTLKLTKTSVDDLGATLKFLEPLDPGFEIIQTSLNNLEKEFQKSLKESDPTISLRNFEKGSELILATIRANNSQFVKEVESPMRTLIRDYENLITQFIDIGLQSETEVQRLFKSITDYETAQRIGSLEVEREAEKDYLEQRNIFIQKFVERESKIKREELKKNVKLTQQQIDEQVKQSKEQFEQLGIQAFESVQNNVLIMGRFRTESIEINAEINKLNNGLEKAVKDGNLSELLGKSIEKDIPKFIKILETVDDKTKKYVQSSIKNMNKALNSYSSGFVNASDLAVTEGFISLDRLVDNLTETIKKAGLVGFPIEKGMTQAGDAIEKIKQLFLTFDERLVITDETATLLLNGMVEKRIAADLVLTQLEKDYTQGQYEQQLEQLENQKKNDILLLKQKGATHEQLLELERLYTSRREKIEGQYTTYVMDQSAIILGNISTFFHEQTAAFKALKYMEAIITAISSSVKAYESALAYGGPAGPVIAPILAATTFAVQQRQAFKILETPEPTVREFGGPIFGPRHSQGGVTVNMEGGEFVINRRAMLNPFVQQMVPMLNSMNENSKPKQMQQPVIKTYVLTGDMISQEKAEKRIQDLARL